MAKLTSHEHRATKLMRSQRGIGDGVSAQLSDATRETPSAGYASSQTEAREGQAGPGGVADGTVLSAKSGNARVGKGLWLKESQHAAKHRGLA